jgi:thymidylate synthase ThyX
MINAHIVADSINPDGHRLTSWILTYPRFIHSEFMTHRCFSRNAASSRAIPIAKSLQAITEEPALPELWARNQRGMEAMEQLPEDELQPVVGEWLRHKEEAIRSALTLSAAGLHKGLVNRLLESWSHITVLATATDHRNFFALRAHPTAMPEFQVLAYRMLAIYLTNKPVPVYWGQWHIPHFAGSTESDLLSLTDRLKIATARCARLSYLTFDGNHDPAADLALHDRLAASGHWSPFEHCAQAIQHRALLEEWGGHYPWSNFDGSIKARGWGQYRKRFEQENKTEVDLQQILSAKPAWVKL